MIEEGSGTATCAVKNSVTKPLVSVVPLAPFASALNTRETGSPSRSSESNWVVVPPPKFCTSSSRLPEAGLYGKGVVRLITMSNAFGPPTGPVSALESDSDPLCTKVLSAPSLFAKVELSTSGALVVVDKKMLTLLNVVENAAPSVVVGMERKPCNEQRTRSELRRAIYLFISLGR